MKYSIFCSSILIALISFILTITASEAVADVSQIVARKLRDSGQILPLEKIYELTKKIKSGRVLETELEEKKGVYIYEVELLDVDGLVWELKLDAKTGKLIKLEIED